MGNIIKKEKILTNNKYIGRSLEKNNKKCFLSKENSERKIMHIIITRFMIEFRKNGFTKIIYKKEYIENGIRVMKKYLFPSLQNQICKDFIWMLKVGDKANITQIKSLLNLSLPFKSVIIYNKDYKNFIRNITKNVDFLITTRIDYDDRIYWNAVNDVRKVVNISRPMLLYGYNRGFIYFEDLNIYTEFYNDFKGYGTGSVFASLIITTNKVNDSYVIDDIGAHTLLRKTLLQNFKKFGLKKLDYEPSIFEKEIPKFVWVRQRFSGTFIWHNKPETRTVNFDLGKFYGIKK